MSNTLTYSLFSEVWGDNDIADSVYTYTNNKSQTNSQSNTIKNNISQSDKSHIYNDLDSFHIMKINNYNKQIEKYNNEIMYLQNQIRIHKDELKINYKDSLKNNKDKPNNIKPSKNNNVNKPANTTNIPILPNITDNITLDNENIDIIMLILSAIFTIMFVSQLKK